jgi:hypothetical protein
MPAWLSPFPIPDAMAAELARQGWTPWRGAEEELPPDGAWLYDAPDGLLSQLGLAPAEMLAGYRQLLDAPIGTWLVALRRLLPNGASDPLAAVLAQQALQQQPGLLDAYLDLELRADLQGDEPDSHYRRRLQDQLAIEPLLAAWKELRDSSALHGTIEELQAELNAARIREEEAREEAELTLLQLHQVDEELEQVFLADREKQRQLEAQAAVELEMAGLRQELEAARQELASLQAALSGAQSSEQAAREECELTLLQLQHVQEDLEKVFLADLEKQRQLEAQAAVELEMAGLSQELEAARQELDSLHASLGVAQSGEQEAREEAELTLLQLHQVQEELEHYFLLSRGQSQQLERYDALQQRSHRLLARCLNAPAAAPAG